MNPLAGRNRVEFHSGSEVCAAWHYPGENTACVIMASGGGVTKEPGTDPFAVPFSEASFSVVAFDYRHWGESGGQPRQIVSIKKQLADWRAAIQFSKTLPEVDPAKLAIWGYSLTAGHCFPVAAQNREVAAAIAHAPLIDGPASTPNAMRCQTPLAGVRSTALGIADALGGLAGREPLLIPLAAEPGRVAMLTTSDSRDGTRALKGAQYPEWSQRIAARSALRIGFYRPVRYAKQVRSPLLLVVHENDQTAPASLAIRAAERAPRAETVCLPGTHYGAYLESHDEAVRIDLDFLTRHLKPVATLQVALS